MLEVLINGVRRGFTEARSVLQALHEAGVEVPAACADARARPGGDCRLCSVQIAGEPHPAAACTRTLVDGMVITTHTPELESFRRTMLGMLAAHVDRTSYDALPEKELHRWMRAYDVAPALERSSVDIVDDSLPHFRFDPAQCIRCYRCVRICEDLQGQFVWRMIGRGGEDHLIVDRGERLADSSCVSCGACIDACPSAALADTTRIGQPQPTSWTRTTCAYCGVGCEMSVGVQANRIVQVRPQPDSPVSKGHLCSKGRYAWDFGAASDRITQPLVRRSGEWIAATWDEALDEAAAALARARDQHGPQSLGVLGSARATNEENYLIQKFARVVLGTHNVDCCARVCHTPTAAAMKHMLGAGAATNSYDDIERAGAILIAGANPTENHPVVGARIKQQARRGAQLIVIDPRRIELADYAAVHLAPRPGTNIPLLHAMGHVILAEGLCDAAFVSARVAGLEEYAAFVREFTPERAADVCGVDARDIVTAARLYASVKPAMCFHGLGMTEHVQGTEGVMALVNLALLTGNIGRAGAGINPLRGQNNVQGGAVMGCEPASLTGGVGVEQGRARFESVWGAALPRTPGLHLLQMIDAAAAGSLRAMYVVGYDILLTLANRNATEQALRRLDALIVQDFVMTETARELGTVFLPVATSFEKDGTFMNAERRIQRVRQTLEPPTGARTDDWIVAQLAARLGVTSGFHFAGAAQIWNEIGRVWPAAAGITYERLEQGGLQWPCPDAASPGTTILHVDRFAAGERARLECVEFAPTIERTNADFPWLLTTGRNLYQFNAGTMTNRTANRMLRPHDSVDIAPEDAAALGVLDGASVRLESRHGVATAPARIDPRVRPGTLFATFHMPESALNRITSAVRDRRVGAPEYKATAVRITRAERRSTATPEEVAACFTSSSPTRKC